jgi:hypothetical protein
MFLYIYNERDREQILLPMNKIPLCLGGGSLKLPVLALSPANPIAP